jgi:hypothetical protein
MSEQENMALIQQANTFIVKNQQDYDNAAEVCKDIKNRIKTIEEYWKTLKDQAYKAWKDVCEKEKELLKPYQAAETAIKDKMVTFQRQKMEEERLLREEQERWKKEEADRLLAAAAEAEKEGKTEHSDYLVEVAEQTQNMTFQAPKVVKTVGTARKVIWKARVINPSLVPVEFAGALLRPIDTGTLDKLAKASKGSMKIPGVEFYEDIQIAVSRG